MKLFEPARIGSMELRNRIVMPPMGTQFAAKGGIISPRSLGYYGRRARGGAGLIIVEFTAVDAKGVTGPFGPGVWDDSFIAGLRQLADIIHAGGARAALQLNHAGARTRPQVISDIPVAPSAIDNASTGVIPRGLTGEEIAQLVDAFGEAARRAKEAGFDAVEIHGTHGYLVAQFLSPACNQRTDEYGGTVRNRARFAVEIVRRARQAVGADYPIIFRMSGTEFRPDALTPDDAREIAVLLEEAGVDALHVSAGSATSREQVSAPILISKGHLVQYAADIKSLVKVPVIAVGGINNLGLANSILRDKSADFIAIGRALIADPDLPLKWQEGREREVTMCIACNTCMDSLRIGGGVRCLMNPLMGREEHTESPAIEPKRLLVYGFGPAALECARVAQLRGHQVCLSTAQRKFDGRWSWLISPFIYDKTRALRAAGVDLKLGRSLDEALLDEWQPERVILEEELVPVIPDIPGIASPHVCTADQILGGAVAAAQESAVAIVGAGNMGCEVAEALLRRGFKPTLVDAGVNFGEGFETLTRTVLTSKLIDEGLAVLRDSRVTAIERGSVLVANHEEELTVPADVVVLALGYTTSAPLPHCLAQSGLRPISLRACQSPIDACSALEAGAMLAREL